VNGTAAEEGVVRDASKTGNLHDILVEDRVHDVSQEKKRVGSTAKGDKKA